MKRALVFFPHNPFPPRSGAHRRCIEMLAGLKDLGYEVTFTSSHYTSQTKWDSIPRPDLEAAGNPGLAIHSPTRADWRYAHYWRLWKKLTKGAMSLNSP